MADRRSLRPAGIAHRAKADIRRELREAQEYRAASSDILRAISRSAFDLTSVLLTVVTHAKVLCGAQMAVLFRYQDGAFRFAVGHGNSSAYEELERRLALQPGDGSLVGRVALERRVVQIADAWRDPGYPRKNDARVGRVRCMLGVPLLREGVPIGVIGLARAKVEAYTERQIELVSTFADQAVIAIENVRLFEELQAAREAAERERDLAEAARTEAVAANRAKSTFLAAMSHEIRTPMNGVLGMMEVLERSSLDQAQARTVTVMRDSAQSLLRIIDDVLDFSKIDAGRMDVEALPFSLGELVAGTIETMLPQARQKNLALFAEASGSGPDRVTGDPVRVRQILFNLVGNAIKFTDRGFVRIDVDSEAESGGSVLVRLTVTDSGIGIDEVARARLFEPFTQADSSTTRRFGGTGLGLSIVRRLAQLMGGDVAVESLTGKGSRFMVRLKLVSADTGSVFGETNTCMAAVPMAPRFLVADDSPVNREVMLRQLELLGLSADIAPDGAAALAQWRGVHHPLVLLDLHMPELDGFGLAEAIRRDEAEHGLARTALIAVTADALKGTEASCLAAGIDGFLAKPILLDPLAHMIQRWVPGFVAHPARDGPMPSRNLIDPEALGRLFGDDPVRLAAMMRRFADSAASDIAAMCSAADARTLASLAHRVSGAARTAGAELLAEQAEQAETAARAGNFAAARLAVDQMEGSLNETVRAMSGNRRGRRVSRPAARTYTRHP